MLISHFNLLGIFASIVLSVGGYKSDKNIAEDNFQQFSAEITSVSETPYAPSGYLKVWVVVEYERENGEKNIGFILFGSLDQILPQKGMNCFLRTKNTVLTGSAEGYDFSKKVIGTEIVSFECE